jgi:hypothetical protein
MRVFSWAWNADTEQIRIPKKRLQRIVRLSLAADYCSQWLTVFDGLGSLPRRPGEAKATPMKRKGRWHSTKPWPAKFVTYLKELFLIFSSNRCDESRRAGTVMRALLGDGLQI